MERRRLTLRTSLVLAVLLQYCCPRVTRCRHRNLDRFPTGIIMIGLRLLVSVVPIYHHYHHALGVLRPKLDGLSWSLLMYG